MAINQPRGMRGLSSDKEVAPDKLYRDIRTPMEIAGEFFADQPAVVMGLSAILLIFAPLFPLFFVVICFPLIWWLTSYPLNRSMTLPLLLPKEAGIEDENDPKPGRFGYHKARGEFLVGNERFQSKPRELWLSFNHLLTHSMVLGSTGAGKTETLVSMTANYLAVGSGVMYSDAKAAPKLGWQIFTLARFFGCEEDFRALNYIKGNTSQEKDPAVRRSHNVNLFAFGSAESITQIIVSIMPPGGAENKLFSERAIGLISAVMPGIIDLRDRAGLLVTPAVIRKAIELPEVEKLKKHPKITRESREAIRAYLASLPGYQEDPGVDARGIPKKQPEEVGRQFGFAQAYFTRALASLSDTYGDIYMVGRGEINFLDMILRRRIGVIMIPALEKAPDEMKNLAKIVLAAQKNAISTGIPPDIEGRKEDVLESLPITAPVPYGIINDEFAFMMTSGYGVTLAQARGLYVAITIAGQDYAGMKREDADEAEQIAENTKVKLVMASEGLGATAELIKEIAGEGVAAAAQNYARNEHSMSGNYIDSKSANFERRSRVDVMDTRQQVEGEGILFWRDKIVPVQTFYHGLDEKAIYSDFVISRLLDVDRPRRGYAAKLYREKSEYRKAMENSIRQGIYLSAEDLETPPRLEWAAEAVSKWKQVVSADMSTSQQETLLFGALLDAMDEDGSFEKEARETLAAAQTEAKKSPKANAKRRSGSGGGQSVKTDKPAEQLAPETFTPDDLPQDYPSESDFIDKEPPSTDELPDELLEPEDDIAAQEAAMADHYGEDEDSGDRGKEIAAKLNSLEDSRGKNVISKAAWLADASLLRDRAYRSYTAEEEKLALQAGESAYRLERGMGASEDVAQEIGLATGGAVINSINYPSNEQFRGQKPKTDEELNAVVARNERILGDWLGSGDNDDDSDPHL